MQVRKGALQRAESMRPPASLSVLSSTPNSGPWVAMEPVRGQGIPICIHHTEAGPRTWPMEEADKSSGATIHTPTKRAIPPKPSAQEQNLLGTAFIPNDAHWERPR